jgi:hypothetical protein
MQNSKNHMQNSKKRSWAYCGARVRKWKQKNGVGVFTMIPQDLANAIKREALAHGKPQWKLLRSAIVHGFQVAMRRGF